MRKRTSQIHRCQGDLGKLRSPEVKVIPVGSPGHYPGQRSMGHFSCVLRYEEKLTFQSLNKHLSTINVCAYCTPGTVHSREQKTQTHFLELASWWGRRIIHNYVSKIQQVRWSETWWENSSRGGKVVLLRKVSRMGDGVQGVNSGHDWV